MLIFQRRRKVVKFREVLDQMFTSISTLDIIGGPPSEGKAKGVAPIGTTDVEVRPRREHPRLPPASPSRSPVAVAGDGVTALQARGGSVSFERFLRTINDCQSIVDAKRMRHQIVSEIKKKESQIGRPHREQRSGAGVPLLTPRRRRTAAFVRVRSAGHKPNELVNGVRVSEMQRYINQLHLARKRCERRIEALGGRTYWVRWPLGRGVAV